MMETDKTSVLECVAYSGKIDLSFFRLSFSDIEYGLQLLSDSLLYLGMYCELDQVVLSPVKYMLLCISYLPPECVVYVCLSRNLPTSCRCNMFLSRRGFVPSLE